MQQIILVVSAIVLGLLTGHLTGGFAFSSAVCLVAGVFLVTPSLFKFQLSDLGLITKQAGAIWTNLWINYGLMVAAALLIGYLSRDIGIAGALLLLALLPGGGMVMMWIRTSGANVKLGFIVFMLNLALLLPVTLIFGAYHDLAAGWFPSPDLSAAGTGTGRTVQPFAPFMILIVIPFVLSRVVRGFLPGIVALTEKHQQLISKATMFGIVFYLFSLSTSQLLFQVDPADFAVAAVATLTFYGVAFLAARHLTPATPEGRAVYWHVATRYITLALILAVFSIDTYGATFILPVMIAYFIQIGAAGQLRSWMMARATSAA
jgi:predicted Na+-dependent transporter